MAESMNNNNEVVEHEQTADEVKNDSAELRQTISFDLDTTPVGDTDVSFKRVKRTSFLDKQVRNADKKRYDENKNNGIDTHEYDNGDMMASN